jgi:hypothetical protein
VSMAVEGIIRRLIGSTGSDMHLIQEVGLDIGHASKVYKNHITGKTSEKWYKIKVGD